MLLGGTHPPRVQGISRRHCPARSPSWLGLLAARRGRGRSPGSAPNWRSWDLLVHSAGGCRCSRWQMLRWSQWRQMFEGQRLCRGRSDPSDAACSAAASGEVIAINSIPATAHAPAAPCTSRPNSTLTLAGTLRQGGGTRVRVASLHPASGCPMQGLPLQGQQGLRAWLRLPTGSSPGPPNWQWQNRAACVHQRAWHPAPPVAQQERRWPPS